MVLFLYQMCIRDRHKLDSILNGDLDEVIDSLIAADQAAKLSNMNE